MVAFATSLIIGLLGSLVIVLYSRRRPVDAPVTWGEAMAAATFVFFLLFWWYGVIPHQWLAYADNELGWRSDKLLLGPGDDLRAAAVHADLPGAARPHRRRHLRPRPRSAHLPLGAVAGSPQDPARCGCPHRSTADRSSGRAETTQHGSHRRQSADAGVPGGLRPPRGRRGLVGEGRQAQAVHPHRPVRVHHVRGLRRHLSLEVHPHGLHVGDRRGRSRSTVRARTRATTSSSPSTTTSAPAAPSASIAAPPA